jgi:hypothetical protein
MILADVSENEDLETTEVKEMKHRSFFAMHFLEPKENSIMKSFTVCSLQHII